MWHAASLAARRRAPLVLRRSLATARKHDSLESFLAAGYAPNTPFYRGKLYEYQCMNWLRSIRGETRCVGGSGDRGVDLEGIWRVGPQRRQPIIVQCKMLHKPATSSQLRDLQGTLARRLLADRRTVGLFIASAGFSSAVVRYAQGTVDLPLILLHLQPPGELCFAVMNPAARAVLPQLGFASIAARGSSLTNDVHTKCMQLLIRERTGPKSI